MFLKNILATTTHLHAQHSLNHMHAIEMIAFTVTQLHPHPAHRRSCAVPFTQHSHQAPPGSTLTTHNAALTTQHPRRTVAGNAATCIYTAAIAQS